MTAVLRPAMLSVGVAVAYCFSQLPADPRELLSKGKFLSAFSSSLPLRKTLVKLVQSTSNYIWNCGLQSMSRVFLGQYSTTYDECISVRIRLNVWRSVEKEFLNAI